MFTRYLMITLTGLMFAASIAPVANADTYRETLSEFRTGYDPDGK